MKRFVFWVGRQFGKNNHIIQLKALAAKYPICVLDVDMLYNNLLFNYHGFKGLPPHMRWEFIDRGIHLSLQLNKDPHEVVPRMWKRFKKIKDVQHGQNQTNA